MLAEIFMMRLEAATRASAGPSTLNNRRYVSFDLAASPSLKDARYPEANLADLKCVPSHSAVSTIFR